MVGRTNSNYREPSISINDISTPEPANDIPNNPRIVYKTAGGKTFLLVSCLFFLINFEMKASKF